MSEIIITTGLYKNYFSKSMPFFRSLKDNANHRCHIVLIDKKIDGDMVRFLKPIQSHYIALNEVDTYREDWPLNRKFYACLEGGEFLRYFDFKDDDIIIHSDSDMIMQRPFNASEIKELHSLKDGEIGMTQTSSPAVTMIEEAKALRIITNMGRIYSDFQGDWEDKPVFCAAFVACRGSTYKKIFEYYVGFHKHMRTHFGHHAAGQWLVNWIGHEVLSIKELNPIFHNAIWFRGSKCKIKNGYLTLNGKNVIFNHTKFNKEFENLYA